MSSDAMGVLPVKLIAPVTDWKDRYKKFQWFVRVEPDRSNGLTKPSGVDVLQMRGVDVSRFVKKLGTLNMSQVEEIATAIAIVVEYV